MPYNIDDDVEQKNEDGKAIIKENSCKTTMAFFCLLAILLFLLGIIVFLLYSTEPFSTNLNNNIVQNPESLHTAAHILGSIDFTQEPCENFYDYACGRAIIEERPLDIFTTKYLNEENKPPFLKKFQNFYESCLNHEVKIDYDNRTHIAKSLLERVGSIILDREVESDYNFTKFIADIILHQSLPLFDVGLDMDPNNATFTLKDIPTTSNLEESYIKYQFIEKSVGQLQEDFPKIDWEILFAILTNKTINRETIIHLYDEENLESIFRRISSAENRKLNNAFLTLLGDNLFESTVISSHRHSREKYCRDQTKELMPDIVNYLHKVIAEAEIVQKKNEIIKEMFENLKREFTNTLQQRSWLDNASKTSITEKLNDLELVLFETVDIEQERLYLEKVYESIDISRGKYQHNYFDLMAFKRRKIFSLMGEPLSPQNVCRTYVDPTKEEPISFHVTNIVCVPFGFYKYIRDDIPPYLIHSKVGFALAKVIGRAFDSIGIDYGVDLANYTRDSYQMFVDRTNVILNLMNPMKFGDKLLFFDLNEGLSESDRIADNTAMKLMEHDFPSFEEQAMLPLIPQNFNRQKLFFLHLVQGWCRRISVMDFTVQAHESHVLPPKLRVANILGNSLEFSKTFGCKPGSEMTRFNESLQFPYLS
ncbi:endothelin-converting enzyme 1-like isoform X2 [Harmonia axyridis]|uniref:endothelin-converting enzyme 1-like isoform X2 n=1 Tax=Harmonia axyridis TaxID=115357 RepID=UPI001E2777C6|nr:endothelin-converting enzyme 1-like isoform X2 [Harmonia axyridis]